MATQVGVGYVPIKGDFSELNKQIDEALSPARFQKLGKAAAAGLAGIGAAAIGAGGALFKVGESFDEAYNTIRVGTGKTGKALEGLEGNFKTVLKSVPTNFGSASKAITELNQRLGLTGKPLERAAEQFLELSRITKTDVGENIAVATKAFNRWGVAISDQPGRLDQLFRASQKTGSSVGELSDGLARFGVPLQQLGFSFEESAALLGTFERQGLNTNAVMAALRGSLSKAAKEGVAPQDAFRKITEQIKAAGSAAEANGIAIKLFGGKAGPELAAAIRNGTLSLEGLVDSITGGTGSIRGAGDATQHFNEKWQQLKNTLLVAIEPVSMRVFDALGDAIDLLGKHTLLAIPALVALGAAITQVALAQAGLSLSNPYVAIAAAVAALTTGFVIAYRESSKFRSALAAVGAVAASVGRAIADVAAVVYVRAQNVGVQIVNGVLLGVSNLYGLLKSAIESQLVAALTSLNPFSPVAHGGEKYIGRPLGEGALKGWIYGSADLPATMTDTIRAAVERARTSVDGLRSKFTDAFSALADDAVTAFDAVMAKLKTPTEITLDTAAFNRQVKSLAAGVTDAKAKLTDAKGALDALSPQELADRLQPLQETLAGAQAKAAKFTAEELAKELKPLERKLQDAKSAQAKLTRKKGTTAFDATTKSYVTTGGETDAEFAQRQQDAADAVTEAQDAITKANDDFTQGQKDSAAEAIKAQKAITKAQVDFGKERVDAAKAVQTAINGVDAAEASQREFYLGIKAKKERKELDASIALRRRHFVARLDDLKTSLGREGATQSEANSRIKKLLKSFGVDYQASGDALGMSFVNGIKETQAAAVDAAAALAASTRRPLTPVPGVTDPKKDATAAAGGAAGAGTASFAPTKPANVPHVKSLEVPRALTDIGKSVGDAVGVAAGAITKLSGTVAKFLAPALAWTVTAFGDTKDAIVAFSHDVVKAWDATVRIAADAWAKFGKPIVDAVAAVAVAIGGMVSGLIRTLHGLVDFVIGILTGDWKQAWHGVVEVVTGVGKLIAAAIVGGAAVIKDSAILLVNTFVLGFKSFVWQVEAIGPWLLTALVDTIKAGAGLLFGVGKWILETVSNTVIAYASLPGQALSAVIGLAISAVKALAGVLVDLGGWLIGQIGIGITAAWELIKTGITTAVSAIGSAMSTAWTAITGAAATAWDAVKNAIMTPIRAARDLLGTVLTGIGNRLDTAWSAVKSAAAAAWDAVKTAVLTPIRAARDVLGTEVLPGITSRLSGAWEAIKGAASDAWGAVRSAILTPVRAARDALDSGENILGGMLNRFESGFAAIIKGVKGFAGDIKDGISDAFRGAAVAVLGFMGKIAGAVNVVLKVIGVPQIDVKKFELAKGGTIAATAGGALTVDQYAAGGEIHRGAKLNAPIIMMGEEAPRHPEFVIPTNPAYRKRAVGLYDQLGSELGVQQFAKGGILGAPIASAAGLLDTIKSIPGKLLGEVTGLIGPLPGVGDLPGWLKGLGRFVLGKVGGFVKDKLSGLLSLGLDFGGSRPDPDQLASITAMVKRMDEVNAHHWDYKYGGGHASFEGPYDCSGLVSAILHAGGLLGSPITTDGLKIFGEGGDGKVITIGVRGSTGRNAHTMMRIGNRYLESGGTNGGAKWVGGWDGDFPIHRHPVGYAQGGIIDQLGLTDPESPLFAGWGLKHGGTIPFVGSYKDGGVLPADGLYLGHKGETVTPVGAGTELKVEVNFRDDRLRDLIDVQVTENDRRRSAEFRAGAIA